MTSEIVIGEFAVNPECVCSIGDIRDLEKRFGFRHGAVISEFPRSWIAEVKEQAQRLEEPTRTAFKDRVSRLRETAMVRMGRNGTGTDWLARTLQSHSTKPFHAILHKVDEGPCRCFADALDDDALFSVLREAKVTRSAQSLVSAIQPLVQGSERFALIDPYFKPDRYFSKFVEELIRCATAVTRKRIYIDVHLESVSNVGVDASEIFSFGEWVAQLGTQLTVTVSWWKDQGNGELHPRYLITERAGVRFDRGFKIPSDMDQQNHDTDVIMMTDAMVKEVESRYSATYAPLEMLHREEYRK